MTPALHPIIPYFEQPSLRLGPVTIHAFGVIVAISVLLGLALTRRRFARLGLDPTIGNGLVGYALVAGFVGAHLFALLLYMPHEVAANPLKIFKVWEDISSFGGILGGALGTALYLKLRAGPLTSNQRLAYFDALAFVFPLALTVGRLACTVAHDHPGTVTRFPFAISLSSDAARAYITAIYERAGRLAELPAPSALSLMGFHDLGWYEFLFLALLVAPLVLIADRRPRHTGFFVRLFLLLYLPTRFLLDFLRVGDARYLGLTPAQHVAVAGILVLTVREIWRRQRTRRVSAVLPEAP